MDGISEIDIINTIKEKLRQDETVITVFESYQIVGNEHQNRLLTIVSGNQTYALFSFAVSKWPPITISDLTIDNVFPINNHFYFSSDSSVAWHQFKISSNNSQNIFYYYPYTTHLKTDYQQFKILLNNLIHELSITDDMINSFNWLNIYKNDDLYVINRNIADGTKTLKKRESKFREELEKREYEYIRYDNYNIFIGTWNVNGQQPINDLTLNDWLGITDDPPDIYAIGFQEIDMSPKAITFSENRPDQVWIKKVMDNLHSNGIYEELITVRLVGMMLIIIIKKDLRKNIIRYTIQSVGTGALNIMGNKGGVGVSLQLNESYICFVNAHLAAHIQEVERRNEDHDEIIRRMQFEYGIERRSIDEHNQVFWFGDLNYRIIDTRTEQQTPLNFNTNNYNLLIKYDQLYNEMLRKRVFINYTEGIVNFRPTYKYDPGTDNWDSSEKGRAPAWCDRVLWKGERIKQLIYNNIMKIQLSDHKPVYSLFQTQIKTRDDIKYKRVHEEVLKTVDKYENDNQPQITVSETDIDFDIITFNELYSRDLLIANNCHLPVHFEFTGKDGKGSQICENWLNISHKMGELITGDCLTIRLDIFINTKLVRKMLKKQRKSGEKIPLDILVLHVENGRDIFITIIGEYRPSCFGLSMFTLLNLKQPAAKMPVEHLLQLENDENNDKNIELINNLNIKVPRELWLLIDYLYKNALKTPHLFTISRKYHKNNNINEIRVWLDNWSQNDFPGTPHTTAEALLMLLESTDKPIIHPFEKECIYYAEHYDKCLEIIQRLTIYRKRIFIYVCSFLNEIQKYTINNRMDDRTLAIIFGRVLLRGCHYNNNNICCNNSNNYNSNNNSNSNNNTNSSTHNLTAGSTAGEREKDERRKLFMLNFLTNDITEFAKNILTSN